MKNKTVNLGDLVTLRSLTATYDAYAGDVLSGRLSPAERRAGGVRKYVVTAPLPTKELYERLRDEIYTKTVETLLDDAYSALEELGNEVREVYDNMPESLQGGMRGCYLDEAATTCEEVAAERPELPACLKGLKIRSLPVLHSGSRRGRADVVGAILSDIAEAVRAATVSETDRGDVASFLDTIDDHESRVSDIHFPGMFG